MNAVIISFAFLAIALSIDAKVLGGSVSPISTHKIRSLQDELCGDETFTGICLNTTECSARGGSSDGECWNGDDCCKIIANCPSSTSPCVIRHSGTVVVNEKGNSNYRRTYRFVKGENICQLRLDFDNFETAQPDAKGYCNNDLMQIISSRNVFGICGNNTHQHVYLEFDSRPYLDISMRIQSLSAKYSIRSSFIGCNSEKRAPINCLQYFSEFDGTVKSFNYGYQQLSNLDYSVCVDDYEGARSIHWSECPGNTFFISGSAQVRQLSSPECKKDWVQIYGQDRYCGRGFNSVTSTSKPFLFAVHFDQLEGSAITLPTDPELCNGMIFDPSLGGYYDCVTVPGPPIACTCSFLPADPPPANPFDPIKDLDFGNTGFCLDYVQM